MKSVKFAIVVAKLAGLMLFLSACSKDKETNNGITKEEISGKWKTDISVGAANQELQMILTSNGASSMEVQPYDGQPEFNGTWELNGKTLIVHFIYANNPDYLRFDASITTKTSISGTLILGGQVGTFTMTRL